MGAARVVLDTLGDRVRASRKKAKLTQDALAERIGAHPKTVSRWENNAQPPEPETLAALGELFGVGEAWLRYGEERAAAELRGDARLGGTATIATGPGRWLPPAAYERLWGYLDRLRTAGADEEQLDEAARIMADPRYGKLNKRTGRAPTEAEAIGDVDAGWAAVSESLTRGGLAIPGPRPDFEED